VHDSSGGREANLDTPLAGGEADRGGDVGLAGTA
jgi:hypothetical protein